MNLLAHAPIARAAAWIAAVALFTLVFGLPLAMLALAAVAGQWNGALPDTLTLRHLAALGGPGQWPALWHSVVPPRWRRPSPCY
ncbi:hypothetical protein [Acidiphilium sp. JA12-A1]|uniref:hypothetical protein n=1 Tax=Acidiphilium sp. JA12-A1 TaxID=1464546 RepID=UPI000462065C|nr:hypothetical protein [Acidiphilium sp. JA12-A1]KDM66828.1 hypothetical protein ACIDI_51c00100 [Acidiphilium sp. JA12-A1]